MTPAPPAQFTPDTVAAPQRRGAHHPGPAPSMGQAPDAASQATRFARIHRQVSLTDAPTLVALRPGMAKGVDRHHRTHDTG